MEQNVPTIMKNAFHAAECMFFALSINDTIIVFSRKVINAYFKLTSDSN